MRLAFALLLISAGLQPTCPGGSIAAIECVNYQPGDTPLRAYITYNAQVAGERPGVLVVRE
jgi:hypothetical protein